MEKRIVPGSLSATGTRRRARGKLPEGDVVFFLLDTVRRLDLQRFYAPYEEETRGAPPFDPAMMVCLLLYAYCVGVFSSRKIALACERHLAFMAIVGQERPDFRTISDFASCMWRRAKTCVCRWCAWRAKRDWCTWATCDRWHQDSGQCVAAQGHELRVYEEGSGASARGD